MLLIFVKGCSSAGFYGENCSKPCHKNCQEGHCHITEGTCLGCQAGYRGPMCNEGKRYYIHLKQLTMNWPCYNVSLQKECSKKRHFLVDNNNNDSKINLRGILINQLYVWNT